MRIAFCLHGCIGGLIGKSGDKRDGSERVHELVSDNNKNYNFDYSIDYFIHSWDTHLEDEYSATYSPVSSLIESQITFPTPNLPNTPRARSHLSRWYSAKESLALKSNHEESNEMKYDLVILGRLDQFWLKQINFNEINPDVYNFDQVDVRGAPYGTTTSREVGDRLIMSSSENMDLFKTMYDSITDIVSNDRGQYGGISSHFCIPLLLKRCGLRDKVDFPYRYWITDHHGDIKDANFTILRYWMAANPA